MVNALLPLLLLAAPARAERVKLVAAYLRADWLYEKQSFPPGKNFWGAGAPPAVGRIFGRGGLPPRVRLPD